MPSSSLCRYWRYLTSRGEFSLRSSDPLTWPLHSTTATKLGLRVSAENWHIFKMFKLSGFSAQDKIYFEIRRENVFLSNSVTFLRIAGLFGLYVIWSHWRTEEEEEQCGFIMNAEQFLLSLHKIHYLFLGVIHSLSSGISYRIPTSDNLFPKEHLNKINGKM